MAIFSPEIPDTADKVGPAEEHPLSTPVSSAISSILALTVSYEP